MASPQRARPAADELTGPFWAAARRRELVVQRCGDCGAWQHPPGTRCYRCGDTAHLAFERVSGDARIVSWTRVLQGLVGGFEAAVPYVNVVVELVEQPGLYMVTDLPGDDPGLAGGLKVGAPMRVDFEDVAPEVTLPQFRFPGGRS